MSGVLWIEAEGVERDVPYQVFTPEAGLEALRGPQAWDVVTIGSSITEPLPLAHRLRAVDDFVEILITVPSARVAAVRQALALDPLAGALTRPVSEGAKIRDVVLEAQKRSAERRRHRDSLRAAQAKLDSAAPASRRPSPLQYATAMWSASPVGALAIERNTRYIVSANRAASQLLEQSEVELIGQLVSAVLPDPSPQVWRELTDLEGKQYAQHVLTRQTNGGELVHLEARGVTLDTKDQDVILLFLWDATERIRLEQVQQQLVIAEREAREQAERAGKARQEVLASVSHDLRSPLQTIVAGVQLLRALGSNGTGKTIETVADKLTTASDQMRHLVEDLLDVSRIESGRLGIELADESVQELVERALDLVSSASESRGIRLHLEPIAPSLSLCCDAHRIVQLLQNVLSNAIKFSPEGGTVTLSATEQGDAVHFSITDQGPGIAPEEARYLFEPFWQSQSDGKSGIGLGLAIARGIAEAHAGCIAAESTPGKGATFRITLPRRPPEMASGEGNDEAAD